MNLAYISPGTSQFLKVLAIHNNLLKNFNSLWYVDFFANHFFFFFLNQPLLEVKYLIVTLITLLLQYTF